MVKGGKQLVRPPPKGKKAKNAHPVTADDFQEAADVHENAGGKHRVGDPVKSARAFLRALDVYDQGLQKYPKNFDLAYNKARLQLEISQNPALLEHIGVEEHAWLLETLATHEHASALNYDNPDVLFNTAQVLSSLAELYAEEDQMQEAVARWERQLEILSLTLSQQEIRFEQHQADLAAAAEAAADEGGVPLGDAQHDGGAAPEAMADTGDGEPADTEMGEESATIEEPVTAFDLLDTVHSSMGALIGLMARSSGSASSRDNLCEMADYLTKTKAAHYLSLLPAALEQMANEEDPTEAPGSMASYHTETARLYAKFVAAHAYHEYENNRMDLATYASRLDEAFSTPTRRNFVKLLQTEATARRALAKTALQIGWLIANDQEGDYDYSDGLAVISSSIIWKQLSLAQDALGAAVSLKDDEAQALRTELYLEKGDIELLRHRILHWPYKTIEPLAENLHLTAGPTLAQNAQKFYQGAASHAQRDGDDETFATASTRLAAARGLAVVYAIRQRVGGSSAADAAAAAAAAAPVPLPPWPTAAEREAIRSDSTLLMEEQLMDDVLLWTIVKDAPPQ